MVALAAETGTSSGVCRSGGGSGGSGRRRQITCVLEYPSFGVDELSPLLVCLRVACSCCRCQGDGRLSRCVLMKLTTSADCLY